MQRYVLMMAMMVFLGTEILALSTPVGQLTLYRIMALGCWPILLYSTIIDSRQIKIDVNNPAWLHPLVYLIWLIWGLFSGLWAGSFKHWVQASFLLLVGVSSVWALVLWIENRFDWNKLARSIWWMMTGLLLWGLFEVFTNTYLLADLSKLDPYNQFALGWTRRIPVTIFTNQNDYATMLIAYISLTVVRCIQTKQSWWKVLYLVYLILTGLLIFLTDSRMILLSTLLYFIILWLLEYRIDYSAKQIIKLAVLAGFILAGVIIITPSFREKVMHLIHIVGPSKNTGDSRRMNLWRNGLVLFSQSLGLGVGAGNIEYQMQMQPFLPVDGFTNIHNWWLEILVSYGAITFVFYVFSYGMMLRQLFELRNWQPVRRRQITNVFIAFLIVYIFASITSANNIKIEWHWVYFGLIISYLRIEYQHYRNEKEGYYELINHIA